MEILVSLLRKMPDKPRCFVEWEAEKHGDMKHIKALLVPAPLDHTKYP